MSTDVGKEDEGGDLPQAKSLLRKNMTPEDFVKYQVLISPKQMQNKKTREQELADEVKSQEKLKSQEASHKGQIDKLELDLQRHRDMLQGVLERIRVVDDEIKDLRAQVAKEKSDSSDGDNASVQTASATQVYSQPDVGEGGPVFDPTAPTPLNPGPFESCDEDIANCEFVWGSRSNFAFWVAGLPGTHSSDFKPPFVGSSFDAPILSSTGASMCSWFWRADVCCWF